MDHSAMNARLIRDMARMFGRREDRFSRIVGSDLIRQAEDYEARHGLTPEDLSAAERSAPTPQRQPR